MFKLVQLKICADFTQINLQMSQLCQEERVYFAILICVQLACGYTSGLPLGSFPASCDIIFEMLKPEHSLNVT